MIHDIWYMIYVYIIKYHCHSIYCTWSSVPTRPPPPEYSHVGWYPVNHRKCGRMPHWNWCSIIRIPKKDPNMASVILNNYTDTKNCTSKNSPGSPNKDHSALLTHMFFVQTLPVWLVHVASNSMSDKIVNTPHITRSATQHRIQASQRSRCPKWTWGPSHRPQGRHPLKAPRSPSTGWKSSQDWPWRANLERLLGKIIWQTLWQAICVPVRPLSVRPCVGLSVWLSVYLLIYLPAHPSICAYVVQR